MKRRPGTSPRGFTLIELMVVVAVIGLLASIAITEFNRFGYRARLAERDAIMRSVAKGIGDVALNNPTRLDGFQGILNPPGTPSAVRRTWAQASVGWAELPVIIDGATFCSYQFAILPRVAGGQELHVWGFCDVDGDGDQSIKEDVYDVLGNALALAAPQPDLPPNDVF